MRKISYIIILLLIMGCAQEKTVEIQEVGKTETSDGYDDLDFLRDEINSLIEKDAWLSEDHYRRIIEGINDFEKQGIDITDLREKSKKLQVVGAPSESQTESRTAPERKGISVRGKGYAELVDVENDKAAWLSNNQVFHVIDVSDPNNAFLERTIEPDGFAGAVGSDENYIYLADSKILKIVSKDNLDDIIGTVEMPLRPSEMIVKENYAYVVDGGTVIIIDISDPKNPKKILEKKFTGGGVSKIQMKDNYLFLAVGLGGMTVIDISNPENPKEVDFFPMNSHEVGLVIKGKYAYLVHITANYDTGGDLSTSFDSNLDIIDISDPTSIKVVGSLVVKTNFKGIGIVGNHAYISGTHPHSLTVVDISDPKNPKDITKGQASGLTLIDILAYKGYVYALDSGNGLRIINVDNPENPKTVQTIKLEQMLSTLHAANDKVYVVAKQIYFNVADVSNPENPKLTYSKAVPSAAYSYTSLVIRKGVAYSNAHFKAFYDLKDPYNPKQVNLDVGVDAIDVRDNILYSVIGEWGLDIYDISDTSNPKLLSRQNFAQGMCRDFSLDENWVVCVANKPYSVNVMDISDLRNPVPKGTQVYEDYLGIVTVKDNIALVGVGHLGLDIYRIESDGSLKFLTKYPEQPGKTAIRDNKAYILGIGILDISNPEKPERIGEIITNGVGEDIEVQGNYMYVADGDAGLTVIPIETQMPEEKPLPTSKDFKIFLPVKKEEVTFEPMGIWPFGVKGGDHPEGHPGIDIEAKDGTPIRAMADGIVSGPQESGHYDYETMNIFHENNFETYYTGNMKDFVFKGGERIKAGDIIAYYDGDTSVHYGLQQKVPYVSVCPVDYMDEQVKKDLEELFEKAVYEERDEFPLLCNPCPESGCR